MLHQPFGDLWVKDGIVDDVLEPVGQESLGTVTEQPAMAYLPIPSNTASWQNEPLSVFSPYCKQPYISV